MRAFVFAIFGLALSYSVSSAQEIRTVQVAAGVPRATDIQNAGDRSGRLFLVQQNGVIRILKDGTLLPEPFLDIRAKTTGVDERGLLGLAFSPAFATTGRFYVNYTNLSGHTVIALYRVSNNPDRADAASETIVLTINQPFANHNGGGLAFGPDGYLYIGMGDGGSGGDPQGNGQRRDTLLGKMLRIDVESDPGRVRIPPTNPFVDTAGVRPEIWATGLRNPWRFAFDRATGDLWIADVGQDNWEEINFQPASSQGGENYGWATMEGKHCFRGTCSTAGLVQPVAEYSHNQDCSVTGGYVYRGGLYPNLRGMYLYGDFCTGRIWGVTRAGDGWSSRLLLDTPFNITTFGVDESGEMYVAHASGDTIHRIEGLRAPAVVNAASFEPGGLVPGSLATVFVSGLIPEPGVIAAASLPLPTSLGGVSVTLNGLPVPLLAVANANGAEQVNFQVPFELRGALADLAVTRAGQSATLAALPIQSAQPAIFARADGTAIAVHNEDYSLASVERPLTAGEYAFVYAVGLAPPAQSPATGTGSPVAPLAVSQARLFLGGVECEVQFAGLAPGLAGVYQVNFRVPQNARGLLPLRLEAGGQASPAVFVSVRQ